MLWLELIISLVILVVGRFLFYSFVRKDPLWALFLRYGGFLGVTAISHFLLGSFWTLVWVIGFPMIGLIVHFFFVKKKGLRFFKAEK